MTGETRGDATAATTTTTPRSRKLQRATFILPKTGERSRRQFTLRDASSRLNSRTPSEEGNQHVYGSGNFGWSARERPTLQVIRDACRTRFDQACAFACSPTGQGIFKCSIAYLLGSMATLVPAISAIFGNRQDSKHMVATVAVYFHPARTVGSMHEATIIAAVAFLYAAFISGGSMAMSIFFAHHNLLALGHALVLIVFVAGGFGFMAFIKQYLGNPLLNVGCSLASLATINILIREGSVQAGVFSMYKVTQNLGMTILGVAIAAVINFVLFPVLARTKLSREMEKNTDLLGEMLISIARAFLHGREHDLDDEYYKTLSKEHQTSLNTMRKNLKDAKKERYVLGHERIYAVETRIVECLNGLSQNLGGLRSAAFAQFTFLEQPNATGRGISTFEDRSTWLSSPSTPMSPEATHYFSNLDSIRESPEERANFATPGGTATPGSVHSVDGTHANLPRNGSIASMTASNIAKSPGDMFIAFISQLGPPTKSLVFTLKQVLDELPFRSAGGNWNPWAARELEVGVNEQFHVSLREAVDLYRESRKAALSTLYQNRAINTAMMAQRGHKSTFSTKTPNTPTTAFPTEARHPPPITKHAKTLFDRNPEEVLADIEEVSACCGHFSFSLLDFAQDVLNYLDILEDLKEEMEAPKRSWTWMLFWKRNECQKQGYGNNALPESNEDPADARFNIPSPVRKADNFGDPERAALGRPWYYGIYKAFRFMRRDDVRFAIKVGLGAALYALPAFLEETRPVFLYWRGEWGLVSYMVVCSMTVGAVNTTGFNRIYGSAIGAFVAAVAWIISNHEGVANPWILAFLGWLMSLVGFYIIVAKDNGPMGRFIFLSYNLVALYSYSLSVHDDDNDDDEGGIDPAIWQIAFHRLVSVSVGTIWAIIVVRCIAPISARRKLREGLCTLWLRMGLIWKRDPLAISLLGEPRSAYMDIREESELQSFLASLRSMRRSANAEFDFQGPFPDKIIGRIMDRCGRMLDAFHAMNVVISKNPACTPGEAAVLGYTRPERFALSARISHLFTVLASSIKLEYPLNDVLPSIDNRRDRLLAKIAEFRLTGEGKESTTEQDYEMLYAYVLVTGQLAQDIEAVGQEIETLFGTLNEENLKLH
ncbi:related to Lactobacillus histidine kinase [Lecanosticta acicola]|uniref:Related to Lactobacillus histidine kinase n=1 Tax=Lecanosticta acicola TaxID=111012 RepID=A0AAI8Z3C8_9PEZI|nr:related to Lactobacillus histidine kinase [Lecanosticta acicola]